MPDCICVTQLVGSCGQAVQEQRDMAVSMTHLARVGPLPQSIYWLLQLEPSRLASVTIRVRRLWHSCNLYTRPLAMRSRTFLTLTPVSYTHLRAHETRHD